MSKLGILPSDIKKKLNPLNTPKGFMGSMSAIPTGDVEESILEWEETALSRMPARYQELSDYVDGEILIGGRKSRGGATGTETTAQLSLYPVSNVHLYLNYIGNPWDARTRGDEIPAEYFEVTPETGLITFQDFTFQEGDTLIATYSHTGMSQSYVLRRIVIDLVATEWARRLYPQDENFEQYQSWADQAYSDLTRMLRDDDGRLGIKVLDDIDLVDETQVAKRVVQPFDPGGAFL